MLEITDTTHFSAVLPSGHDFHARNIWNISPRVDEHAAVFPGDTAYSQRLHFALSPGCPVNVYSITMSPHTSAHADAPMHCASGGKASGELDLTPYLGPCRVIHCIDCGPLVLPEHIGHALADLPPRVLLRTARTAFEIDACRYIARSRHLAETARHLNKTP